jgi:hypothetical protein
MLGKSSALWFCIWDRVLLSLLFLLWAWGLNSGFHACKAATVWLEPCLHSEIGSGWPWTHDLLSYASWVARITGMCHYGWPKFILFYLFIGGSGGDWTQDLEYPMQAFNHWVVLPAHEKVFWVLYLFQTVSHMIVSDSKCMWFYHPFQWFWWLGFFRLVFSLLKNTDPIIFAYISKYKYCSINSLDTGEKSLGCKP